MTTKVLVRYVELRRYGIPWTRKHITSLMKKGHFPKALQLSPRCIAWDSDDLVEWINTRPIANALREELGDGLEDGRAAQEELAIRSVAVG